MRLSDYKSIAVIQTAFIGDLVLALPMATAIKRAAPDCRLTFVTTPISAQIATACSDIDNVLSYDKRGLEKGYSGIKAMAEKLKGCDLVISPHRSLRSTIIAKKSGAKTTVGFNTGSLSVLFSKRAKYNPKIHEIERNLKLLENFEDYEYDKDICARLTFNETTIAEAEHKVEDISGPYVVLAPGSVWATKRWKGEYFAELAKMIESKGLQVVIIGGKEDINIAEQITTSTKAHSLAGKTSILESIYIISKAKAIVTNDSSPIHFAGLVSCPTIAIFGATIPEFGFAPRGKKDKAIGVENMKCRPCGIHGGRKCPIGTHDCMKKITPEQVFSELWHLLTD